MRKNYEGLLLKEKIPKILKKSKKNGFVTLLDEAFFSEEIEKGVGF